MKEKNGKMKEAKEGGGKKGRRKGKMERNGEENVG